MTRRPRSRLPRKLPSPAEHAVRATGRATDHDRAARRPSLHEQLKSNHVAGRSARFSRVDVERTMRAVVAGEPSSLLGLVPFLSLTIEHVAAANRHVFGWEGDGPRARIDPLRTIESFEAACVRVLEVAREGGRLACATARPASLLGIHRALAAAAAGAGGDVLGAASSAPIEPHGYRLWWFDGVATVTDGVSLLGDVVVEAADELLFLLPRPDLVVADGVFAGRAVAAGFEVVALAGLDAVALAVAVWRGMAIRVVPLDEHRSPASYAPLLGLLAEVYARAEPDPLATHLRVRAGARATGTAPRTPPSDA